MVKVKNVANENLAKEKRIKRISGLLKEVFGSEVDVEVLPVGIQIKEKKTDTIVGNLPDYMSMMELKNPMYESKAIEFGERYEKEIGLIHPNIEKEFIIETDYR